MSAKSEQVRILEHLKPRHREVLELIALGMTTKGIASTLHLSTKTVEWHRTELMKKTGLFNIAMLTRLAVRLGLVDYAGRI